MAKELTIFTPEDDARLQKLLDRQDGGQALTAAERSEAEALATRAEKATLQKIRAKTRQAVEDKGKE